MLNLSSGLDSVDLECNRIANTWESLGERENQARLPSPFALLTEQDKTNSAFLIPVILYSNNNSISSLRPTMAIGVAQ